MPLDEEALHRPNRQRPIDVAAAAGALARRGTDVRAHRRDRIRLAAEDVALLEPALRGEVQVATAIGSDRTRFLALDVALEPGGVDRLNEEILDGVDGHEGVVPLRACWGQAGRQTEGICRGGIYTAERPTAQADGGPPHPRRPDRSSHGGMAPAGLVAIRSGWGRRSGIRRHLGRRRRLRRGRGVFEAGLGGSPRPRRRRSPRGAAHRPRRPRSRRPSPRHHGGDAHRGRPDP